MQHLQRLRLLWEALCGESDAACIQYNAEQHMPDWKHALFGVIFQQKLLQAILSSYGCLLWDLSFCSMLTAQLLHAGMAEWPTELPLRCSQPAAWSWP